MFSNDKIFVGPASDCSSHHWEPVPELARKSRAVITDCLVTDAKREGGAETKRALITSSAAKTGGRTERQPQEERVTRRKDGSIPSGSGVSFFFSLFVFFSSPSPLTPPALHRSEIRQQKKRTSMMKLRGKCAVLLEA